MNPEEHLRRQRELRARAREAAEADAVTVWRCGLCDRIRTTEETLRVHRALVHPTHDPPPHRPH